MWQRTRGRPMTSAADAAPQYLQDPKLPAADEFSIFTGEPMHSLRDMLTEVTFTPGPGEEFAATSMFNGLRSLVPFCHAGAEGYKHRARLPGAELHPPRTHAQQRLPLLRAPGQGHPRQGA
jgi:hypothetical protein